MWKCGNIDKGDVDIIRKKFAFLVLTLIFCFVILQVVFSKTIDSILVTYSNVYIYMILCCLFFIICSLCHLCLVVLDRGRGGRGGGRGGGGGGGGGGGEMRLSYTFKHDW